MWRIFFLCAWEDLIHSFLLRSRRWAVVCKSLKCSLLLQRLSSRLQSTSTWLTLLFLGEACGSVIQAPNLVPEVFTVSGPVIFISFPHAAKHSTQLQSDANETTASVLVGNLEWITKCWVAWICSWLILQSTEKGVLALDTNTCFILESDNQLTNCQKASTRKSPPDTFEG